jgi:hypothetical protein
VLIGSAGLLSTAFAVMWFLVDAEQFPQHQLIPYREHTVSIMKILSSAYVLFSGIWLNE